MTGVLVCIPTLNGPGRLGQLFVSLADCTDLSGHDVKILVCDDGSQADMLEKNKTEVQVALKLRERAGLQLIEHGERRGIAKAWNTLARAASSEVIVWLNDDVEVVDHWLDALVYTLTHNKNLGMVGLNSFISVSKTALKSIYPEEARDKYWHLIQPRVDYNEARMLDAGGSLLSSQGCAFGMTREAYEAAGGFDERYFVYYEELDMGVTMRRMGRRNYILSYPLIFHTGGATNSNPGNLNAQEHMARSKRLFEEKWGKSLDELREEFRQQPRTEEPLREWTTQIHNWR